MPSLFPASFRAQLEHLAIEFARLAASFGEGRRAQSGMAGHTEFVGHAPYTQGDDPRRIDWNAYGRLGRLYVKHFEHERERTLTIAPDLTASMNDGEPDKRVAALRLTAAFAVLAIRGHITVEIILGERRERFEGQGRVPAVFSVLESARPVAAPFFPALARTLCGRQSPRNTVVISDLMEDSASLDGLFPLAAYGRSLAIVGLLSPQDTKPEFSGAMSLTDAEDGSALSLDLNDTAAIAYREELAAHLDQWRARCTRHRIAFETALTDAALDDLFLRDLPRAGVL